MEFKNYMPSDYYLSKIITEFENYDKTKTNFQTPIHLRNQPVNGKLSLNHIEFIEFFIRLLKPKNFLELGVQFGECTIKIIDLIPENYYAVDIAKNNNIDYLTENKKNFCFFNTTTDLFFDNMKKLDKNLNLDMVFIDANHSHSSSYNDFLNVKTHLNEDGIIFFHDTYPSSEYWTDEGLCFDCYKTAELIRKNHSSEFEIITFPVNPGISIARKCSKQLLWLK
jgi:predicted O-methyltransferase YrrM